MSVSTARSGQPQVIEGLRVVVAWWHMEPARSALDALALESGAHPLVRRLAPDKTPTDHGTDLRSRTARAHRRARRRLRRWADRSARSMVRIRGGTRPARALLRISREPAATTPTLSAVTAFEALLPDSGPLLVVVTDTHSAAVAWEATVGRPDVAVVLGLQAAARLVSIVVTTATPWTNWIDVVSDSDPDHTYAALPGPLGEQSIAPHDLRGESTASGVPVPAPPPSAVSPRLVMGPANYAGQATAWVLATERLLGVPAQNVMVARADAPFQFASDHPVTGTEWGLAAIRRRIAADAVAPATHVVLESMRPLLDVAGGAASAWDFAAGGRDARALVESGRKLAVVLHGSESRVPDQHAARYPHSPFAPGQESPQVTRLQGATAAVHRELDSLGHEVVRFVSTPDMLDFVPGAQWLPVVVRPDAFVPGAPVLARRVPVVLHAPSNPLLKGSDVVDEALTRLHDEGRVEYRRLYGVPPTLVADHVRDADVVIDQVALGNLGVMALEAMACGRLLMAHALPEVLGRYDEEVPMVVVDPVSLVDQLCSALDARDESREIAAAAPAFVRRHHDGRRSVEVLSPFLDRSPGP